MKKMILAGTLGLIAAPFFGQEASAGPVTYSTINSQLCIGAAGCGVAEQTFGGSVSGVKVQFVGVNNVTVDASPNTFSSFGNIEVTCVDGSVTCSSQSLAGLNLYINIAQTGPTGGNASLPGGVFQTAFNLPLSPTIGGGSSLVEVKWPSPNAVSIGAVTYSLFSTSAFLNPPSNANAPVGRVGITAIISDATRVTPVSEPGTLALAGLGLAGLAHLRRKKNGKAA